jgi:D-xylose transport system permease protein
MSEIINEKATTTAPATAAAAATVEVPSYMPRQTFGQLLRGDLGFLPVLLTLVVIAIYFQIA